MDICVRYVSAITVTNTVSRLFISILLQKVIQHRRMSKGFKRYVLIKYNATICIS